MSRTPGASPEAIQAVSDAYEDTIERYVQYQDHLVATGQLSGYELKTYLRRKRQTLLWKLLLDEVIESLPALHGDAPAELTRPRHRSDGRIACDRGGRSRARARARRAGCGCDPGRRAVPLGGMSESLRCDAVVIGSGAGGAPVAAALAEAGPRRRRARSR